MKRSVEREYYNPEIQGMGFASCRDGLRRRDEKGGEGDGEEMAKGMAKRITKRTAKITAKSLEGLPAGGCRHSS
jgi:hypothetical protein